MNHVDFLLGWDIESTGDRASLPTGLIHMETDFLFFCHIFLTLLKSHLVLCQMTSKALFMIFTEDPQCTKNSVLSFTIFECKILPYG